jgi:hypothetical protein
LLECINNPINDYFYAIRHGATLRNKKCIDK